MLNSKLSIFVRFIRLICVNKAERFGNSLELKDAFPPPFDAIFRINDSFNFDKTALPVAVFL